MEIFLKWLVSIPLFCLHLLWVDIGIRSVPLGEKKRDTTHLGCQEKIHRRKERNELEFFPLNTSAVLLTQGLRASEGFENLYFHKLEIWDYKGEK